MRQHISFLKSLWLSIALFAPVVALAVTSKEMEQARTIAAKAYLRYANDGSGYLDDLNPTTMEELEASLKNKEKENIKAFKAIEVPSDYPSWDKEKLIQYWAVTVFQNKNLLEKGRGGRIRARSLISKMSVTEPSANATAENSPAQETAKKDESQTAPKESAGSKDSNINELEAELNQLPDESVIEENDLEVKKATNYTWVYIMVLAILVGVVIALVVYAANVMKKNSAGILPSAGASSTDQSEEIERLESLVADKDAEITMLKKKLEKANEQIAVLQETARNSENSSQRASHTQAEPGTRNATALRSIYLGRANSRGIFVRADRSLNPGQSLFLLETSDGFSGTFKVAESPAVWHLALSNPKEYLDTACTGNDLDNTLHASRIVNISVGTAVFEGGCWRVVRKARISYK